MYTFMEDVQFDVHSNSTFLIITCLVHLQALMFKLRHSSGCLEVWYLRYDDHPSMFHLCLWI